MKVWHYLLFVISHVSISFRECSFIELNTLSFLPKKLSPVFYCTLCIEGFYHVYSSRKWFTNPTVRSLTWSCLLIKEIWSNEGRKSVQSITQSLTHISATQENYITSLDCHYSIRKYKRQRSIGSRKMQRYIIRPDTCQEANTNEKWKV